MLPRRGLLILGCRRYAAFVFGVFLFLFGVCLPPKAWSEDGAAGFVSLSLPEGLTVDGSLRLRAETANWFEPQQKDLNSSYGFGGTKLRLGTRYKNDWLIARLEGQYNQAYDLPANAVGIGASYFNENNHRQSPGNAGIRQGSLKAAFSSEAGVLNSTAGRFLYTGGLEIQSSDPAVDWVKRNRIAERLIAPYEFNFGRSMDGLRLDFDRIGTGNITAAVFHPTQGNVATDLNQEIDDITVATAVLTSEEGLAPQRSEVQLFYYYYEDRRGAQVVQNQPADDASRNAEIHTFGAHALAVYPVSALELDSMLWGALQIGSYGSLDQQAFAFAVEQGVRLADRPELPWLRLGWDYGSGDGDPTDSRHGTFFAMLPAARNYAMTPFYNSMNNSDLFAQIMWQPASMIGLQSGFHQLWLANSSDLLYFGSGADRSSAQFFGYAGLPSTGSDSLASVVDLTISSPLTKYFSLRAYYGHAFGGSVLKNQFQDHDVDYGYLQGLFEF